MAELDSCLSPTSCDYRSWAGFSYFRRSRRSRSTSWARRRTSAAPRSVDSNAPLDARRVFDALEVSLGGTEIVRAARAVAAATAAGDAETDVGPVNPGI